ncbi:putative repeat protein (TIGR02543 family)/prepilin-type N-terminal cleavage/methylation domain-containing protein [Sedimentibacter acidaminivorans]|uniref:Repeat protein (TIGR02543 family)/prepilin-type N-terminal cleavage/methylation domain-containing protein n=1 Tax=Sedimentibacter acidaminivorans TaxID=913099 RepID=A0ABS4GI28_9FIRM|nr:InlB B-repeat-containing protein [Sedimentibacter acidaminivorans]MBP1927333.1 putative repeat protein (TIGR02543 family)/prepilin-type N-terminal cleavage/methylation domain-containing protein [Sedimentibacter acidaminivorans]
MRTRKGFTLIELILAIALLGILAISFISVFPSQLKNISFGGNITEDAFEDQGVLEEIIFDVKSRIQDGDSLSDIPEWSEAPDVEVLGQTVAMQKLYYESTGSNRDMTVYLSERLAEIEVRNLLNVQNVSIKVSNDPLNLVADLTTAPYLTAIYDDNSAQVGFFANLFKWWRTEPGVDPATLKFPDDYVLISVSQDTKILTNLLDNVGANSYVVLTVTPVDVNGFRGSSVMSSNKVYVMGAEWRVGAFPWVDIDNDYEYDSSDYDLIKESVTNKLDARSPYPDPSDPSVNLDLTDGSLFVPMKVSPSYSSEPGNEAIEVDGSEKIEWLIERNINLAKDFTVLNGSDIKIISGLGSNGGTVFIHPYVELDSSGDPVVVGGVPQLLDTGVSLKTSGDILLEAAGKGNVYMYGNAELEGNNVSIKSRGSIGINNSRIESDGDVILDSDDDAYITGSRKITINETDFESSNTGSKIIVNSPEDLYFKGGSWSTEQTLYINEGDAVYFERGDNRVNNLGNLHLGDTSLIKFKTSMIDDLSNQLRIRVVKESDTKMKLITHNYFRNIGYSTASNNIVFNLENTWKDIGNSTSNIEFSASILSGDGDVDDIKFSFDGSDIINIEQNTSTQTDLTRVRLEFRDKYSNRQIKGVGIFSYEIDASGNATIIVEEELPVDTYFITFDSNGGTPVDAMEKAYGDPITAPPAPTRLGFTFIGWDPELPSYMPNYDFTVRANWEPIQYYVTFYGNGGTPVESTKSIYYGNSYSSIMTTPSYSGYHFDGWFTTANGPGEEVLSSDIYSLFGNQNLYARWSNNNYTVTFDSNGGSTPNPSTKTVDYGNEYGNLPEPTRTGYTFNGWYTERTGGTRIYSNTQVTIIGNHTLYAHWTGRTYTVTFDSNEGSTPNPRTKTVTFGSTYGTLPNVSRNRYDFDGWFTDQSGGTRITENTQVYTDSNHTLYAHWSSSGGSCPFVYSFDGTDYNFEHESIPFSISKALETTSYGTLRKLESKDGIYNVRIAENLDEKSFINGFSLYAVDYPRDSDVEYVKVDIDGNPHTIAEKQYPLRIEEKVTGNDVLYEVTTDGVLAGTDVRQMNTKDFMSIYEVEFNKPSSEAELGKFMISVQKSYFTTILGEYYLDKVNAKNDFWLLEKLLGLPLIENRFEDFMKVITMNVEVWDGKKWIEQGNIKAGRDLMEEFLVPIDLSLIDPNTDKVIIRLSHGAGLFEIESVSMDYSINQIDRVRELKISSALFNEETDVYSDFKKHNDNKRTKLIKGDIIDLEYVAPELDENMNRGYYVALTGYYYMDPEIREVSDILESGDKSTITNIKTILDSIKGIYEDNRSVIKWLFGLMKDSFKKPLDDKVEQIIKSQYNEIMEYWNKK